MSTRTCLRLGGLLLVTAGVRAQQPAHGAWVPGPLEPVPQYMSGTNSVAQGRVAVPMLVGTQDQWISQAVLTVGGTDVHVYNHVPGEPGVVVLSLRAVFDSTRFEPGSLVEVRIKAETNLGHIYQTSPSYPVRNRIMSFECPTFKNQNQLSAAQVAADILDVRFDTVVHDYLGWNAGNILQELGSSSVYYHSTHGAPLEHWTDFWTSPYLTLTPFVYNDYRNDYFPGNVYPPYNTTDATPLFLWVADACLMGQSPLWQSLGQYPNTHFGTFGDPPPNMAFVGFTGFVAVENADNLPSMLFTRMMPWHFQTVREARDWILENHVSYAPLKICRPGELEYTFDLNASDLVVNGDPFTRISGCYTGTDALPPDQWFMPVN